MGIEAVKRYKKRPYSLNPDTNLLNKLDLSEQKARLANEQSGILACQRYNEFKGIIPNISTGIVQPNASPPSANLASNQLPLPPSIEEKAK